MFLTLEIGGRFQFSTPVSTYEDAREVAAIWKYLLRLKEDYIIYLTIKK